MDISQLYKAAFDINSSNMVCDGEIIIAKDGEKTLLSVLVDDKEISNYDFNEIKEFRMAAHIGCGTMEIEMKDGDIFRICRFTQSYINPLSEFIKAVNYYITSGEYSEIHLEHTVCPKCGKKFIENSTVCIKCANKVSIVKKFFDLGKKYIPGFIIAGALVLFNNIITLIIPQINRVLVDGYLSGKAATEKPFLDMKPAYAVVLLVSIMLFLHIIMRVISIISARIRNKTGTGFVDHLRVKLYNKIQLLSMTSVSRRTTGDLIKRVTEDTSTIAEFVKSETVWITQISVIFIGVSAYFIIARPVLALFIFLPVPLALFAVSRFWNFIHRRFERQWILSSRANGILHDIVRGIRVVKVFGTEEAEVAKFNNANKKLAQISMENEQLFSLLFPSLSFLIGAGEFLVIYFGARAVLGDSLIGGPMSIGELIQTMSYVGYIYGPLRWLTFLPRSIANAVTSMAKLNEILDEEPDIKDKENALRPVIKGDISFKNATFGYKSYEPVLKNVYLDIKQGEMIGIVGHSGVGKSTLINLIMRLYDLNSGLLQIDNINIKDISKETLCNSIGVVFQETFLFAGSIYDNIIYAKPDSTPEEVFAAAKIGNAHEFIVRLPDAYNTLVGENGYSLSGGERQRIAIARAILRNPAILILDEATASLDTETESKIQEALHRLIKGRTTIAIAHRLSTLRHANRLIVLEKGMLAETGTHDELLRKQGIYYNLVMAQRKTTKMADNKKPAVV